MSKTLKNQEFGVYNPKIAYVKLEILEHTKLIFKRIK